MENEQNTKSYVMPKEHHEKASVRIFPTWIKLMKVLVKDDHYYLNTVKKKNGHYLISGKETEMSNKVDLRRENRLVHG